MLREVGGGLGAAGFVEVQQTQGSAGTHGEDLLVVKVPVGPHQRIRIGPEQLLGGLPCGPADGGALRLRRRNVPGMHQPQIHRALQSRQFDGGRPRRERLERGALRRSPGQGMLPDPGPGPFLPGIFKDHFADRGVDSQIEQGTPGQRHEGEAARGGGKNFRGEEVPGAEELVHPFVPAHCFVGLPGPEDLEVVFPGPDHGTLVGPVHHHLTQRRRMPQGGETPVAAVPQELQLPRPEVGRPDPCPAGRRQLQNVVLRGVVGPGPDDLPFGVVSIQDGGRDGRMPAHWISSGIRGTGWRSMWWIRRPGDALPVPRERGSPAMSPTGTKNRPSAASVRPSRHRTDPG